MPFIPLPLSVCPENVDDLIRSLHMFAPVLQVLPSTVFFVKNTKAEYVYANDTLLHRLQLPDMAALIGKTSENLFQSEWGRSYTQQDKEVLSNGKIISNRLELHTYASGELGWCITHKMPVRNPLGEIIAMLGVSVDVETNDSNRPELNKKIALLEKYIECRNACLKIVFQTGISVLALLEYAHFCTKNGKFIKTTAAAVL